MLLTLNLSAPCCGEDLGCLQGPFPSLPTLPTPLAASFPGLQLGKEMRPLCWRGSESHSETNPPPPYFLGCGCWGGLSSAAFMNLELTDRVRAETANESSSERAPGNSTGLPPRGEGAELCW